MSSMTPFRSRVTYGRGAWSYRSAYRSRDASSSCCASVSWSCWSWTCSSWTLRSWTSRWSSLSRLRSARSLRSSAISCPLVIRSTGSTIAPPRGVCVAPSPLGHVLHGKQYERLTLHLGFDAPGVEQHLLPTDLREVVLHLEALEGVILRQHLFEEQPQLRYVPLAAAEVVDEPLLGLRPCDPEHLAEGGVHGFHPEPSVEYHQGLAHGLHDGAGENLGSRSVDVEDRQ